MKLKNLLIPVFSILFFASCKKDKATNCDKTMSSIAGTYSIVKIEMGSGGTYQDVTAFLLESCQRDDQLILGSNGTVTYKDAGTVCDSPGDDSGSWEIDSDGKITVNAGSIDASTADISSFDCSSLVITGSDSGIDYRLTLRK